jgi:hypothetical protein
MEIFITGLACLGAITLSIAIGIISLVIDDKTKSDGVVLIAIVSILTLVIITLTTYILT